MHLIYLGSTVHQMLLDTWINNEQYCLLLYAKPQLCPLSVTLCSVPFMFY